MKTIVGAFAFLLMVPAAMAEEPMQLDDNQMDRIVAGNDLGTAPDQIAINFPDSFSSGKGPLQVTGVEMVMPGDNVSSVILKAKKAFLKAKKAF
ncbi:hypothetical protein [Thiohalophilus sp.]|uniref:hypothetical protein n=1 Tax=Thiohalophilus sp. TaxID=3028392 RepID=UPI002ACEB669|nr:hypothetical protein [Thiohalophilus sp.]MDZ7662955.1 hypothetical protein [Thiohalophilus sp.]